MYNTLGKMFQWDQVELYYSESEHTLHEEINQKWK